MGKNSFIKLKEIFDGIDKKEFAKLSLKLVIFLFFVILSLKISLDIVEAIPTHTFERDTEGFYNFKKVPLTEIKIRDRSKVLMKNMTNLISVSYTHLTLPTIYSV